MADFQLKVTAETQDAERKLGGVQRLADEAAKPRQLKLEFPNYSDVSKNFADLKKDIDSATNSIKQFYRFSSQLPVGPVKNINEMAGQLRSVATAANESGRSVGDAGSVIKGTLDTAGKAAESLVGRLTRIAFSLYAISEAAKLTQAAFGGLFNETIGREIKLRETILKTQTTLASTNKVFRNGTEITDPYEKIVALTGEVGRRIDSIRERSIALAGVTSNEVIEVFGIVASQVGQIGGGLKEAEDLAINFSAALGTFGIPLYQARQEIGSILRGDITMDSYLAKALGITNDDIAKAKTQAGGVVKFLEERLAASVAGQRIAAQGFAGVVSNIRDLSELINQNFGRGLLDPLIDGLSRVFGFLFSIRKQLFDIASLAGSSVGNLLSIGIGRTLGASGGTRRTEGGGGGSGSRGTVDTRSKPQQAGFGADDVLNGVEATIKRVTVEVNKALSTVYLQLATLTERVANAFGAITKGLAALALGLLSLKLEQLKALIGALEGLSPVLLAATKGVSAFLAMWGEFMKLPIVQELSQISANMRLLEMTGVMPLIKTAFILQGVIENWGKVTEFVITQFNKLRAIIGGLIAYLGTMAVAIGEAGRRMLSAWQPSGVALKALKAELEQVVVQLNEVGAAAQQAGSKIGSLNTQGKAAGGGVVALIGNFIKFNLLMFAISATLGLVLERFSAWKENQDKIASDKRAEEALRRLRTTYKDIGDSADEATKRAKAFEQSLVDAKYDEAVQRLEEVRKKLAEIKDLTSGNNLDLGDYGRRLLQLFNPANFEALQKQKPGELFADAVYRVQLEKQKKAETERDKWARELNKKTAESNIQLEAQNRSNLEKEIGDLRKQQEDQLFQLRQQRAQKEVEIFRLAGELRIFQMEQANKKLIEGEEGASAAALESLTNYLSIRERGELDIESAKQEMVIEAANLEKQISDYRLENEKKIAEIKKKAGEYEQKMADYRRQVAGQTAAGSGGGAATFGSTGRVRNAPDWVHGHFQTNTGTLNDLISDVIPVLKALLDQGIPVELSNGTRIAGGKDDAYYTRMLRNAAQQHRHSGDGRSIDLFVPEGTKVPVPLTNITGNTGRSGITGGLPGTGKSWLGHLAPGSKAGGAGVVAPPTAPNFAEVGAPAVGRYAEAVRSLAGAMQRARALQEALTNAKTAAAFEEIAKAAFPKVALEQYDDQLIEARISLDALAASSQDAYDPERLRLAVDLQTRLAIQERELDQIRATAQKTLKPTELLKLEDDLAKRKAQFVADLQKEKQLREQLLPLVRAQAAIEGLRRDTAAVPFDLQRAGVQAIGTMASAFGNEDPVRRRMIEAEVRIAERRIQLEQDLTKSTEEVRRELSAYAIAQRAAAQTLGELDKAVEDFTAVMGTIREVSKTMADGYKGFFREVLTGGDLQEAMNTMLQNVTDKFLSMALDAAFKPMEQLFAQQLQQLFGIEDPAQQFAREQEAAMAAIADTQDAAANSQQRAADTQVRAAELQMQAATSGALPGSTGPMSQQFDSVMGPNGQPVPVNQLQVLPYSGDITKPFVNATQNATATLTDLSEQVKTSVTALPNFTESVSRFSSTAMTTERDLSVAGGVTSQLTDRFKGLMKAAGTAMTVLGGVAMGFAGAQQMSKGGTYNTLMGLAGIFGAVSSIAGGLGSIGGLFRGGGTTSAFSAGGVPNLPGLSGTGALSFAGGGYTGTGPRTGGLDGRGGFMAMLHPNETVVDHSPYAATSAYLDNPVAATPMRVPSEPIRLETRVINGVEYATIDQLREATSRAEQRGAERGRSLALGSLQNSVRARKRVGLS